MTKKPDKICGNCRFWKLQEITSDEPLMGWGYCDCLAGAMPVIEMNEDLNLREKIVFDSHFGCIFWEGKDE
jgi:hypothetical protein